MHVTIQLNGTTPLVEHNIRLANPDDEITKAIAAITGKRKKTEEDRAEIARLEWYGGLYVSDGEPVMPTPNIRRCIVKAATVKRLGRAVERGLVMRQIEVPLDYDGPRNVDALWADPKYRYASMVGVQGKRTTRMRPQFPQWSLTADAELLTDVLDLSDLSEIASLAGLMEGLGDNRVNGYGRFTAIVKPA